MITLLLTLTSCPSCTWFLDRCSHKAGDVLRVDESRREQQTGCGWSLNSLFLILFDRWKRRKKEFETSIKRLTPRTAAVDAAGSPTTIRLLQSLQTIEISDFHIFMCPSDDKLLKIVCERSRITWIFSLYLKTYENAKENSLLVAPFREDPPPAPPNHTERSSITCQGLSRAQILPKIEPTQTRRAPASPVERLR